MISNRFVAQPIALSCKISTTGSEIIPESTRFTLRTQVAFAWLETTAGFTLPLDRLANRRMPSILSEYSATDPETLMRKPFHHPLADDPRELAGYDGWSQDVYEDFQRLQRGRITQSDFDEKYQRIVSVLVLDMTGFTNTAIHHGEVHSLLRIYDAQRVCLPVLKDFSAELIRAFADDLVALFEHPAAAVDAALDIHDRIDMFNQSELSGPAPTECCVGIGYGKVYAIGPNRAMGDEMNQASKLGEDLARSRETLLTRNAFEGVRSREDLHFERQTMDDELFPYYRAHRKRPESRKKAGRRIEVA